MKALLVRLGAIGDIVHAVPVAAALRRACPDARIEWVVDRRHAAVLEIFPVADRVVPLDFGSWLAVVRDARALAAERYDVALDVQGLMKSALVARLSGAARVIGFDRAALREPAARLLYTETVEPDDAGHVVRKNLSLLHALRVHGAEIEMPMAPPASAVADEVSRAHGGAFAVINPGGGWPNKRWPADRFGALAAALRAREGLPSAIVWGPGEEALAAEVASHANGAAVVAPRTRLTDLAAVLRRAAIVVSGDSGPLHLAVAAGTPAVALHGPTSPGRNGSWRPDDAALSRFDGCGCHHKRRCTAARWCLSTIAVDEVAAAVGERLARARAARSA
jgi:lipopolysaccharide heptosyltransferase I